MGSGSDGSTHMALRGSKPIFTAGWQQGFAVATESAMPCTFQIFTEADPTYDAATDTWTSTKVVHYSGAARIQPIRTARDRRDAGNDTFILSYRVQIPLSTVDFRPGMEGRCTDSPLNPTLKNYVYTMREVGDSGNPLETTLEFDVNQETIA